jgi:hypothetical protein
MAGNIIKTLPDFNPADPNTGAQEWQRYKRNFLVHLDAQGLDDKPGKRKVGMLLANMHCVQADDRKILYGHQNMAPDLVDKNFIIQISSH